VKKPYYLITAYIFFLSCKKDVVYEFDYSAINTDIVENCAFESCPEVAISLLKIQQPISISKKVQIVLEETIIKILEEEGQESQNISQAVANYINNIQTGYPEDTTLKGLNKINITTEVISTSNTLLSIALDYYKYTGGAHGYGEIYYYNFNPENGKIYPRDAYFKDEKGFLNVAKSKFLAMYGLKEDTILSGEGFFFENDNFHLSKQIGFTDTEVILLYNPYEIASYAEGQIELRIPKEEAIGFLNFF